VWVRHGVGSGDDEPRSGDERQRLREIKASNLASAARNTKQME
jgi:hypothetical protein